MGVRKEREMIWLVLALGLTLRLLSLNQSLWLDEAINALATQNYSLWGMLTEYAIGDFHPPLYFAVSWIWNNFFGTSEAVIRFPSVIFATLTIFIVYLIGQKLYSKKLGLMAAFFLAVNPLHIYYSQEARMYSLAAMAVAINIFLFVKLLKREKVNYFSLIGSNFLVAMSDYVASLIFPAELVAIFLLRKLPGIKRLAVFWFGCLFIAAVLSAWWVPVFLQQLDVGAVASAKLPAWKFIVGAFDIKAVPLTFVKFIIGRISMQDKLFYLLSVAPAGILFFFLFFRGFKTGDSLIRKLLFSWLVVPVSLASGFSIFIPVYNYFRLLYTLPAFLILAALGILSFKGKLAHAFFAMVSLVFLVSAFLYLSNPKFQRENWRGVVEYLKIREGEKKILFESSGTLPPFDYYNRGELEAKGALADFPVFEESGLADILSFAGETRDIYLVDYLVDITDKNRLVAKKLSGIGYELSETKDFTGVGFVYHYRKNE